MFQYNKGWPSGNEKTVGVTGCDTNRHPIKNIFVSQRVAMNVQILSYCRRGYVSVFEIFKSSIQVSITFFGIFKWLNYEYGIGYLKKKKKKKKIENIQYVLRTWKCS